MPSAQSQPFQEIAGLIKGLLTTLGLIRPLALFLRVGWLWGGALAPKKTHMIGGFHAPGTKVSAVEWTKSTV